MTFLWASFPVCSVSVARQGRAVQGGLSPPCHTLCSLFSVHSVPHSATLLSPAVSCYNMDHSQTTLYHLHQPSKKLRHQQINVHKKLMSHNWCEYLKLTIHWVSRWVCSDYFIHPWICCHLLPRPIRGSFNLGLCRGTGWPLTDRPFCSYLTICILNNFKL